MKNQANIAAAHRTPTTLDTATLRSLKSRSGISGEPTRDSITRNTARSTPAAASRPTVWADVQPFSFPFTIA
jgi:hypothetical protein